MGACVTSRELIHNFAAIAARVAAGEELIVTRHGKPLVKIIPPTPNSSASADRAALVRKALAFKLSSGIGNLGHFERGEAYDD